jgi:hypothetical protein
MISYNENDIKNNYCGNCHSWHDEMKLEKQINKWISVKDKLPPFNHEVLIYDGESFHLGSLYNYEFVGDENEWIQQRDGHSIDATHWMELPSPPK